MDPTAATWTQRITRNLEQVRARLERAAREAGRHATDIQLLPVTKSRPLEALRALLDLGEAECAENRAPELVEKHAALEAEGRMPRWHFIGPLQRNKARRVVERVSVVHSVHGLSLLQTLDRLSAELEKPLEIFLQVGLTGEEAKQGFALPELSQAISAAAEAPFLRLRGLMTMGPQNDPGLTRTREIFATLAAEARTVERADPGLWLRGRCELSMGMSGDLECAVSAGSTLVRIGSDLFA